MTTSATSRRTLLTGIAVGTALLGAVVAFVPEQPHRPASPPRSEATAVQQPAPLGTAPQAIPPEAEPAARPLNPPPGLTPPAATLWERVVRSDDHRQRPFVVLDKQAATLFVFDARGALQGASRVLLGRAIGDDSVPGIGERAIADIRPHERTTPAGRFAAEPGLNHEHEDIVWIDYDAAVSLHRLRASAAPAERRPQRLASPSVEDKRISYGCVNIPPPFYDAHIRPTLGQGGGMVYVLPETRSLAQQFPNLFGRESALPA